MMHAIHKQRMIEQTQRVSAVLPEAVYARTQRIYFCLVDVWIGDNWVGQIDVRANGKITPRALAKRVAAV